MNRRDVRERLIEDEALYEELRRLSHLELAWFVAKWVATALIVLGFAACAHMASDHGFTAALTATAVAVVLALWARNERWRYFDLIDEKLIESGLIDPELI